MYNAAKTLIGSIATSGRVKDDELTTYLAATRAVKWILNQEIDDYLNNQLYNEAIHHQTTDAELERTKPGEDRVELARAKADQRKVLLSQFDALDEKFKRFLALQH